MKLIHVWLLFVWSCCALIAALCMNAMYTDLWMCKAEVMVNLCRQHSSGKS